MHQNVLLSLYLFINRIEFSFFVTHYSFELFILFIYLFIIIILVLPKIKRTSARLYMKKTTVAESTPGLFVTYLV